MHIPFGESQAGVMVESAVNAFRYWLEKKEAFAPQQIIEAVLPFNFEHTEGPETHTSAVLPPAAALEGTSRRPLTSAAPLALQQTTENVAVTPHATALNLRLSKLADMRVKLKSGGAEATIEAQVLSRPIAYIDPVVCKTIAHPGSKAVWLARIRASTTRIPRQVRLRAASIQQQLSSPQRKSNSAPLATLKLPKKNIGDGGGVGEPRAGGKWRVTFSEKRDRLLEL